MKDDEEESEVPEGAAVFPEIPEELGVHPLLLGVLHATVFFVGSTHEVVNPDAADEALGRIETYLGRLEGNDLRRIEEDMVCLITYARSEKWDRGLIQALKTFLSDMGVTSADEE
jgi:hypothetical protein